MSSKKKKVITIAACLACLLAVAVVASVVPTEKGAGSKAEGHSGVAQIALPGIPSSEDQEMSGDSAEKIEVASGVGQDSNVTQSSNPEQPSGNPESQQVNQSGGSSPNHQPSAQEPSKRWVEDTEQVWVVDREAWTEQIPIYSTVEVAICNICGADITGNSSAHNKQHMLAGEGSGWHSETSRVQSGTESIYHEAIGHYETRVTGGHWE